MEKKIQAKHIPEALILGALSSKWMTHWMSVDPEWSLPAKVWQLRDIPQKVLRAKLHSMKRRGLIHGCHCGCRGDWHLAEGCKGC